MLVFIKAEKGRSKPVLRQREPALGVSGTGDWTKYIPEPHG